MVKSCHILFPALRPGGISVAEDVQTAFRKNRGGSLTLEAPNSIAYFALRLAELETKGGNLDKAEEILRRAIARRPRVRQLDASLTGVLRRQKCWAEALGANARSIRLHPRPERPALTLLQAETHQLLGNAAAARREVLRGIADVDTLAPSYRMLCRLEMTDGNHKAAADAIDKALQLDPNNAEYQALKASLAGTDRARAAAPQR